MDNTNNEATSHSPTPALSAIMSNPNNAATAAANDSKLLDLPLEMLQKITDELGDDMLLPVRSTCRTLDNATFDRFAKAFFETTFCCVYYEDRWKALLDILGSPRLGSRVSAVNFHGSCLDVHKIQVAQGYQQKTFKSAQEEAGSAVLEEVSQTWPSRCLMTKVLLALKLAHQSRGLNTAFNLSQCPGMQLDQFPVHRDMLVTTASIGLPLAALALSYDNTDSLDDLVTFLEPELLSCTSTIEAFYYGRSVEAPAHGEFHSNKRLDMSITILESAKDLCKLHLDLYDKMCADIGPSWVEYSTKFLSASNMSTITDLTLSSMAITEHVLIAALRRCNPAHVTALRMENTRLLDVAQGWYGVFKLLSTMPALATLKMALLIEHPEEPMLLDFKDLKYGRKTKYQGQKVVISYRKAKKVRAGLQELVAGPLRQVRVPWQEV